MRGHAGLTPFPLSGAKVASRRHVGCVSRPAPPLTPQPLQAAARRRGGEGLDLAEAGARSPVLLAASFWSPEKGLIAGRRAGR